MAALAPSSSSSRRSHESDKDVMVGEFKRLEEIGRGSFAAVYKAIHVEKRGYVAIKSVNLSKLNKKLRDNLFSEIHILRKLHHPHIVSLFECREGTAHIHLIMEYCQLGDLSMFIKSRDKIGRNEHMKEMMRNYPNPTVGGLNEVIVRHFLKQLASALKFLRDRNLIHRDVKPQNLLLIPPPSSVASAKGIAFAEGLPYAPDDRDLEPPVGVASFPTLKIADFGFARSLPATSLAETLCGSPLYMAPEILRYEKYDAKADLWSVGTVLYEMVTGRPPFRAANHVELLRRIEKGLDQIKFPDDVKMSAEIRTLIKSLLKRSPTERLSFKDFFANPTIQDEIPGLLSADRSTGLSEANMSSEAPESQSRSNRRALTSSPVENLASRNAATRTSSDVRQASGARTKRMSSGRPDEIDEINENYVDALEKLPRDTRPGIRHMATAPAAQHLPSPSRHRPDPLLMQRTTSREQAKSATNSPTLREQPSRRTSGTRDYLTSEANTGDKTSRLALEERERAAQEVAFERDYVLVEKKTVEVNALADELAASPQIHGNTHGQGNPHQGIMVRRNTTQGAPSTGTQITSALALTSKRPDHLRTASHERRIRTSSTPSAISKAINLASGRLFSFGVSPPLGIGRTGPSPPLYGAFPAYTVNSGSMLLIGDGTNAAPLDEDAKTVNAIEESAHKSNVVYGFAEVKYKQLIPLAPSMDHGLGLQEVGMPKDGNSVEDGGLTVDAIATLSEEALVLYVKALSLLARSMDVAASWWARKSKGEPEHDSPTSRSSATQAAQTFSYGTRVNNVVQWVRTRFNEVLEKAEFVRLKLIDAQRRLPSDHPSHPSHHQNAASGSVPGMGTSAGNVNLTPGLSAEKLMYERALEMSRSAAVNELVCEDLPGCEMAYMTAIRMLEAVLDGDDDAGARLRSANDNESTNPPPELFSIVNPEDMEGVKNLVSGIRSRLRTLRKKMQVMASRNAATITPSAAKSAKPSSATNVSAEGAPTSR